MVLDIFRYFLLTGLNVPIVPNVLTVLTAHFAVAIERSQFDRKSVFFFFFAVAARAVTAITAGNDTEGQPYQKQPPKPTQDHESVC